MKNNLKKCLLFSLLVIVPIFMTSCTTNATYLSNSDKVFLVKGCLYLELAWWNLETAERDNKTWTYISEANDNLIYFSDFEIDKDNSEIRSIWERFNRLNFNEAIIDVYDPYTGGEIAVAGPEFSKIRVKLRELKHDCNIAVQNHISNRN